MRVDQCPTYGSEAGKRAPGQLVELASGRVVGIVDCEVDGPTCERRGHVEARLDQSLPPLLGTLLKLCNAVIQHLLELGGELEAIFDSVERQAGANPDHHRYGERAQGKGADRSAHRQ